MAKKKTKKQSSSAGPIVLLVAGGLIILAVILFAVIPSLTDQPSNTVAEQDIPYPEINRVGLEDARRALENGEATFLDVRTADAYAAGHIPGAVNMASEEIPSRAAELDPNRWIITYCT